MITKKCEYCGKEFQVIDCRKDTARFCSKECMNNASKGEYNCKCEICGKLLHRKPYTLEKNKHVTCSRECLNKLKSILYTGEGNHQYGLKGELNASFKGKIIKKKNNKVVDVLIHESTHPYCDNNGRVKLHRLIVEQNYKRFDNKYFDKVNNRIVLKKTVDVHHLNFNHDDNRIENLVPLTKREHRILHSANNIIVRNKLNGRIIGVFKQGELLENPEVDNQQPSLSSNTFEGSTTNNRVQTDNAEDSNIDTSALCNQCNDIV